MGFPGGSEVKNSPSNGGDAGDMGLILGVRKISWRRKWQPIPVFLLRESRGERSLVSYRLHRFAKSQT